MSYQVFALKWRPKNFDELIGQNHIVTTLKSAIQKNRLAHAYLFAGPRGVGKTSTARILAKALNCKEGPTISSCQRCAACLEISQSQSLDVIEIDGASNRGIDEVRALRESVKFAPVGGKFKIYIIDEVHMLTQEAFNALLKTLEEPPEFVKFIFATTQPHKVIPTILSRCQRFDFRRISVTEIITQLEKIVVQEKIDVDREVLLCLARSSDGSLRDAESVLDQLASFSKDKISLKDVISVLGLVEQEALFEITHKIIQKDAKGALGILNNIIEQGKDTGVFLTELIEHFRNLMIARITMADPKLIDLPQEICERLLKQAQNFSLEEIFSAFNILLNTQEMSKRLESLRIPLEIGLIKLAHDKKGLSFNSTPSKHSQESGQFSIKPQPSLEHTRQSYISEESKAPVSVTSEDSTLSTSLDNIKSTWQNIIDNLRTIKMSVATYLNEGTPVKLQDRILTISFPKNYSLHKEALEKKENKAIIEKTVSELFNTGLRINFILSQEISKEDSQTSPFLKSALDTFKGRVVKEE